MLPQLLKLLFLKRLESGTDPNSRFSVPVSVPFFKKVCSLSHFGSISVPVFINSDSEITKNFQNWVLERFFLIAFSKMLLIFNKFSMISPKIGDPQEPKCATGTEMVEIQTQFNFSEFRFSVSGK